MFYSYALSEDRASSVVYQHASSTASGETVAINTFKGARPQVLAVVGAEVYSLYYSVGKNVSVASSEGVALARLSFHHYVQSAAAVSAETAKAAAKHVALAFVALTSSNSAGLLFPRVYHGVVGYASVGVTRHIFLIAKVVLASGSNVAAIQRLFGRGFYAASSESGALIKGIAALRPAVSAGSMVALKKVGKIGPSTHESQADALPRTIGKALGWAAAEAVVIWRAIPLHNPVASVQAPHLSFGGNLLGRVFGVPSTGVTVLARGIASIRQGSEAQVAGVGRATARLFGSASTNAAADVRSPGKVLGAAAASVTNTVRAFLLARGVVSASVAAAQRAAFFVGRAFPATQAQAAALFESHVRNIPLGSAEGQTAATTPNATKTTLELLHVAQVQVLAASRLMVHVAGVASAAAQSGARIIHASRAVAGVQAVAVLFPLAAFRAFSSVSAQVLALFRTPGIARGTTSPESVAHPTNNNRGIAPSTTTTQSPAVGRTTGRLIAYAETNAPALARGTFRTLRAVSANDASIRTPHQRLMTAFQAQAAAMVQWYHFFVADWAYQQTTLLPPGGGPAEPPAFGPIDPADQTTFAFDWSSRAYANDPIVYASVESVPAGLSFYGPPFISGSLVEVTVTPFTAASLPVTYSLRCTAGFASGRQSSFSIPVPVRML